MSFFDDRDNGENDSSFEETLDNDSGSDIEASIEDMISSEEDDNTSVENENIQHSDETFFYNWKGSLKKGGSG